MSLSTQHSSSSIRFVYFDLGNILVSFNRETASRNVARLFVKNTNAEPTSEEIAKADDLMHPSGLQNKLETGTISEAEFAIVMRAGYPERTRDVDDASIMRAISDMFTPIHEMTEVLQRVRQTKIPIGVLSNTCGAHWNWVNSQSFPVMEGPFDVQVVSYEAESMKPDRVIYEVAEKRASEFVSSRSGEALDPRQVLFVDDRDENIEAARGFGWNAEVCLGGFGVEKVLVNYGVLSECLLDPKDTKVSS